MKIYTTEVDTPIIDAAINTFNEEMSDDSATVEFFKDLKQAIEKEAPALPEAFNELVSTNQEFLNAVVSVLEDIDSLLMVLGTKTIEIEEKRQL